jgi:hypothetical protein
MEARRALLERAAAIAGISISQLLDRIAKRRDPLCAIAPNFASTRIPAFSLLAERRVYRRGPAKASDPKVDAPFGIDPMRRS